MQTVQAVHAVHEVSSGLGFLLARPLFNYIATFITEPGKILDFPSSSYHVYMATNQDPAPSAFVVGGQALSHYKTLKRKGYEVDLSVQADNDLKYVLSLALFPRRKAVLLARDLTPETACSVLMCVYYLLLCSISLYIFGGVLRYA